MSRLTTTNEPSDNRSAAMFTKAPQESRSRPAYAPSGPATVKSNSSRGRRAARSRTCAGPPPGSVETSSSSTRSGSATPPPAELSPERRRQGQDERGPKRVDGAPGGIVAAPHRPPAYARFRAQPIVLATLRDPAGKKAPDDQGLGHVGEPGEPAHPHPEIVVLGHGESRVVSARLLDDGAARHHGRMHEGISANEGAADAGIVGRWAQDSDGESGGVHLLGAGAQEPDGGLGIEDGALAREALGQGHVVGVEAGHERRPGHPERAIERACQPLMVARALDAETQVAHGGEEIG